MICVLALIVFSILGIFSASHRKVATEAFDCVFRRVTLRPCNSGLDQRLKGQILGKLLSRSEKAAWFINRYFEVLSWSLLLLTVVSFALSVRGGYLYYVYGNCNGPSSSGFCVFDPTGKNNQVSALSTDCSITPKKESSLKPEPLTLDEYPKQAVANPNANQIIFIGCYSCEYTRKSYPMIQRLRHSNQTDYYFLHFPVKDGTDYLTRYGAAMYQIDPQKFWEFNDKIFSEDISKVSDQSYTDKVMSDIGFNVEQVKALANDPEIDEAITKHYDEIQATGIYGTPTIFINGKAFVGPKPFRVYEIQMDGGVLKHLWKKVTSLSLK